jgi:recombination protein RecA
MSEPQIDRHKALDSLLSKQKKKAEKKGYEMVIGRASGLPEQWRTIMPQALGYPLFDHWSGGGLPKGGITTFQGPPSVGKTSLAYMLIAAYQAKGLTVLLVDYEESFDEKWAQTLGVDTDKMHYIAPETLERGLDTIERIAKEGVLDVVILDSLDAAIPEGSLYKKGSGIKHGADKDIDEDTIALKPRKLSQWLPRVRYHFRKYSTSLIIIAQQRIQLSNAGGFPGMAGGNALAHFNFLNLKISRANSKEDLVLKDHSVAFKMKIRVDKSKYAGLRKDDVMETFFFHDQGFNAGYEAVAMSLAGELPVCPLVNSSSQSSLFTDSDGKEHKISGAKPETVYTKMQEMNQLDNFLGMVGY